MVARILIWSLLDSKTTVAELHARLPALPPGDSWIVNGAQDRFGLVSFGDELPELGIVSDLIGHPPDVAEEFDVLD